MSSIMLPAQTLMEAMTVTASLVLKEMDSIAQVMLFTINVNYRLIHYNRYR